MTNYLELKTWQDSHSSVWREIVSRFGQSDYDDETKRKKHMATLKAEWDAKAYSRNRKAKYDLLNQDEMRFDDSINNTTTWIDTIKEIKASYPKP
tara:strand:+ start:699 stop:983 length:285 start_codon:yes stop_codon:yes gene_type:complete